ncbi:hypothetical protein TNIN_457221 [Trichonephila inaurata madagascariensis]|uniref:Uncharacterized protein n=1 Tax=Trichonephila inaurata madagascariensis TaxID=2747483 RepID=A0A8X6X8J9_9ARAC|nr:hypothetical protein TNIN_457221 [Trichonephila inaurata madagascariensis]
MTKISDFLLDLESIWDLLSNPTDRIMVMQTEEEVCPEFAQEIGNVTQALGRDAKLECIVDNLGRFRCHRRQFMLRIYQLPGRHLSELNVVYFFIKRRNPGRKEGEKKLVISRC